MNFAAASNAKPHHITTGHSSIKQEAEQYCKAMGPTIPPSQQADPEKQAYFTRHTSLSQHIARLEAELQQLAPPSLATTPASEPSYERDHAQVAFRRELGGLKNALGKARERIRRLGGQSQHQQERQQHHGRARERAAAPAAAGAVEQEATDKIEVDLVSVQDGLRACALAHRREVEALRWQEGVLTKEVEEAVTAAAAAAAAHGEEDFIPNNDEENKTKKLASSKSKSATTRSTTTKEKKAPARSQARLRAMEFQAAIDALDEEILAHGGLTGGWPVEEHGKFLALWRDFRGLEEEGEEEEEEDPVAEVKGNLLLLERAARVLWARSEGEVMRHIVWYVEHRHRTRARAGLVKQKQEAEEEAGREEEEAGLHLDEVTRRRRTVAEWRRRRQAQEEEEEEARKRQVWEAQQRKAAQEKRRAAWTKEQLAKHREKKEEEERRRAVERARLKEEMEEEAEYQRLVHGGGEGGREDVADNPKILKLVLERRARLSLKHAEERRGRAWARRSTRQGEERARRQRAGLEEVAWQEALMGDGDDVMRRGGGGGGTGRSLPRFVYRDVGRLNQPTEASSRRAYDDEELDEKDTARLYCLAHERPLPPGF